MKPSVLNVIDGSRFADELLPNAADGFPTTRESYCMDSDHVCVGSMALHILRGKEPESDLGITF